MSKTLQKEDGLIQFCYDADVGTGSFEDMVRRIKWNYEAKFDKKPQDGCPVSVCGPFGDHGYIEPFLDCSAYYHAAAPSGEAGGAGATERVFSAPPKRSVFTRYFNNPSSSSSRARTYFQYGFPQTESCNDESSQWTVESVVDTVLLELEDYLLDLEMNLCNESGPAGGHGKPSVGGKEERRCHVPAAAMASIDLLTSFDVAQQSLKAKLSDDQFFTYSPWKKSSTEVATALATAAGISEEGISKDDGNPNSSTLFCTTVDYDHLPWPWISLPPSNSMQMGMSTWSEGEPSLSDAEAKVPDKVREGKSEDRCRGETCSDATTDKPLLHQFSPMNHPSLLTIKSSLSLSPGSGNGGPLFLSSASLPPLRTANLANPNAMLTLESRPIPVLSPLGVHRAEGGERILSGAGVDHMNLIQLVGNPAHGLQPKLVQSWRNPAYVQWASQWDSVSINYGL